MTINDIKTPQDIYDYMEEHIQYGWLDYNGKLHINEMDNIRTLHRICSVPESIRLGVGTCVEQVELMSYLLNKINIPNRKFCFRTYEPSDAEVEGNIFMHCICIYYMNNKVYQLEHPNEKYKDIYESDSLEDALEIVYSRYEDHGESRTLTEYYEVQPGWTFKEFNDYVNSLDETKKRC